MATSNSNPTENKPCYAKAKYKFVGKNNDEVY